MKQPIKTHCAKGHEKKPIGTTGVMYCPQCTKEQSRNRRRTQRADKQAQTLKRVWI